MNVYHNSQDPAYRSPKGAVAAGTRICLSLAVEGECPCPGCFLYLYMDGTNAEPAAMEGVRHSRNLQLFSIEIVASASPALCWYYFSITGTDGSPLYYGNNPQQLGGEGLL